MSGTASEDRGSGGRPGHAAHPPHLAHHFHTPEQQFQSGKLGMWIFLATELLLFGGLFCAYAVYRANHPEIFVYAHQFLSKTLGGVNTLILIGSSFTMAWAVRCAQLGQRRKQMVLLALTLLCAGAFLGVKKVEYEQKWEHGLLWGKRYQPHEHAEHVGDMAPDAGHHAAGPPANPLEAPPAVPRAAEGPPGLARPVPPGGHGPTPEPRNVQIFFGIYFAMTGLHGLHVIAGMAAIAWILGRTAKGHFGPAYFTPVDLVGLYWHVVDIIWIFLFPLLYLVS